jgi:predicted DCC family thiol-disulfide oxidoreductase YuxK
MRVEPEFPLKVFYDGCCSVCAGQIEEYRRKDRAGRLVLVDISAPGFNPRAYGLAPADFMHQMHAIDQSGRIYRGTRALRAVWQAFPTSALYGFLGRFITLPGVDLLARLGYWGFARIRKYLPGRNRAVCKLDHKYL